MTYAPSFILGKLSLEKTPLKLKSSLAIEIARYWLNNGMELKMLLYPLPVLSPPFPRTFIIKDNANNDRRPPSCHFPALMTRFPVIAFTNEEAIDIINEAAIDTIIAARKPTSFSFT